MDNHEKLEKAYDACAWKRKFDGVPAGDIKHAWHARSDAGTAEAEKVLPTLQEETETVVRSLWLGSDSLGEVLIVTEEPWND